MYRSRQGEAGILVFIALAVLALIYMGFSGLKASFGSAPAGLPATVASSSSATLTTVVAQALFATSTNCTSRIVTTQGSAIRLTFTDRVGNTPTGNYGVWQGASTTVAYDGGLYGCGFTRAFSYQTQVVSLDDVR